MEVSGIVCGVLMSPNTCSWNFEWGGSRMIVWVYISHRLSGNVNRQRIREQSYHFSHPQSKVNKVLKDATFSVDVFQRSCLAFFPDYGCCQARSSPRYIPSLKAEMHGWLFWAPRGALSPKHESHRLCEGTGHRDKSRAALALALQIGPLLNPFICMCFVGECTSFRN